MGQEKTQHENGREQRNERQGRVGRRIGLGVILCGPLPASVGTRSGPPAAADPAGTVLSSLEFWGLMHSCLGLNNPATKLQAKPLLDQGSPYAKLGCGDKSWVSDTSCPRPPESKALEGQKDARLWRRGSMSRPRLSLCLC